MSCEENQWLCEVHHYLMSDGRCSCPERIDDKPVCGHKFGANHICQLCGIMEFQTKRPACGETESQSELSSLHEILSVKYDNAQNNLINHPEECGGEKYIKGFCEGLLEAMALCGNHKSIVMQGNLIKSQSKFIETYRRTLEQYGNHPLAEGGFIACAMIDQLEQKLTDMRTYSQSKLPFNEIKEK